MYQAWVVQKFGDVPYNVVLGKEYATTDEALEDINDYEKMFGKCEVGYIEPSGTEIPTSKRKKESLFKGLIDAIVMWFI